MQTFVQFAALAVGFVVRLRQLDAGPFGQQLDRLGIGAFFDIHDEMDDIAALVAAKAVIDLLGRRNAERRRIFSVKRTQAKKIAAAAFVQTDILLDNRNQFAAGLDFFNDLFRDQAADEVSLFLLQQPVCRSGNQIKNLSVHSYLP